MSRSVSKTATEAFVTERNNALRRDKHKHLPSLNRNKQVCFEVSLLRGGQRCTHKPQFKDTRTKYLSRKHNTRASAI